MKPLKKLFFYILFFFSLCASGQDFESAADYLEFIGKEQETVTRNTWKYTKAVAHSNSSSNIMKKRQVLITTIERAIAKIEKTKAYEGDQELADKKMTESQIEYEKNFYSYAEKHDINIIESENDLGKKMAISNKVFDHSNELYLIFFKVYINEVYLWEAIKKNDVNGIQQNANALKQTAEEGITILKQVKPYKTDRSLIIANKAVFEFFIDEAENKIPAIADYLILKEDFETIKNAIDKIPENKRTQEQINAYNTKIEAINNAGEKYNKVSTGLSERRQRILTEMDDAKARYLERHVPKE